MKKASKPLSWRRTAAKAAGDLEPDQWATIVAFYGGLCAWCEREPWTQQDHVHPIAKGGRHTAANVVPSCERDNRRKFTAAGRLPRRLHPFMVAADTAARHEALGESFTVAPFKIEEKAE